MKDKFTNNQENKIDFGLPIQVIQSKRKTISIELKPDRILVKAPQRMSKQEVYGFVMKKKDWIEKHIKIMQERSKGMENVWPYTAEEIKSFAEKAVAVIPQRVKHYAEIIGVDYGRITIRNQKTRWGSCSSKGNLNFNCLLMLFPEDVIDSVVVHELCHRKYMNHSAVFYAEVENVFPEYRRCQKWLKENGGAYLRRLP